MQHCTRYQWSHCQEEKQKCTLPLQTRLCDLSVYTTRKVGDAKKDCTIGVLHCEIKSREKYEKVITYLTPAPPPPKKKTNKQNNGDPYLSMFIVTLSAMSIQDVLYAT